MSFDQDPYESVTISGSDFAEMCDEIKRLTAQKDDLLAALDEISRWTDRYTSPNFPVAIFAYRAIAKAKGEG